MGWGGREGLGSSRGREGEGNVRGGIVADCLSRSVCPDIEGIRRLEDDLTAAKTTATQSLSTLDGLR